MTNIIIAVLLCVSSTVVYAIDLICEVEYASSDIAETSRQF